eukprot:TRINITY_DN48999_c0_g1_i1.p1 TRINITY_DN48999_c0_g1~~TRINITY_DN48999_c0_g1_i1.p1  ORF type:complete len:345 (-),score=66.91 TRINITY_DN48999_c0_g1_i1:222-1256(-)
MIPSAQEMLAILHAVALGGLYIAVSSSLISFNKYLMHEGRFPYALALTTWHMTVTTVLSLGLSTAMPRLYPTLPKAKENISQVLKYVFPLGLCFAVALYCSNKAYVYCTVAFLQFCKEGNVALVFVLSCMVGLQTFSWTKVGVLSIVVAGCTICAHGEVKFLWLGLAIQLTSQFAETSKNIIGEIVMTGAGLKLDPLTFVYFQAPCSLLPLAGALFLRWTPEMGQALEVMWPYLIANALLAFCLNVTIATTIKQLSAVAFVIIGIIKDMAIVASSAMLFGDKVTAVQWFGFLVTTAGCVLWSHIKLQEQAAKKHEEEAQEKDPLVKMNINSVKYSRGASKAETA